MPIATTTTTTSLLLVGNQQQQQQQQQNPPGRFGTTVTYYHQRIFHHPTTKCCCCRRRHLEASSSTSSSSSSSSSNNSLLEDDIIVISRELRKAYIHGGTDETIQLLLSTSSPGEQQDKEGTLPSPPPLLPKILQWNVSGNVLVRAAASSSSSSSFGGGGRLHVGDHHHSNNNTNATHLLLSSLSPQQKSIVSGIINSILGACCYLCLVAFNNNNNNNNNHHDFNFKECYAKGEQSTASSRHNNNNNNFKAIVSLVCQIMESYRRISNLLEPNLVSLCLFYTTLLKASLSSSLYDGDDDNAEIDELELSSWRNLANDVLLEANALHNNHNNNNLNNNNNNSSSRLLSESEKENLCIHHGVKVLDETGDYIVVSKPSGMVCYHLNVDDDDKNNMEQQTKLSASTSSRKDKKRPGRRRKRHHQRLEQQRQSPSLEEILLQYLPSSSLSSLSTLNGNKGGKGFVHRIDKGTSGCIVLAKTNSIHAQLISHFFLRRVQKTYQALVFYFFKMHDDNDNDNNRDSSSTKSSMLLHHSSTSLRGSSIISSNDDDENTGTATASVANLPIGGKPAQSAYVVEQTWCLGGDHRHHLQHLNDDSGRRIRSSLRIARLRVKPYQGRKHQIRIHLSKVLQSPILLDPLYGGEAIMFHVPRERKSEESTLCQKRSKKQFCLHAQKLYIPDCGIDVVDEHPPWWKDVINEVVDGQG